MHVPRSLLVPWLVVFSGCGDDGGTPIDAGPDAGPDALVTCQPLGATGAFLKRAGNPRMRAGQAFADGKLDLSISGPDVHWNDVALRWELYYATSHATSFADADKTQLIRHATSPDRQTWTIDDAPALAAATDVDAWDHVTTEAPSVVFNPAAPADRRYLLVYSGARRAFPFPGYTFADSAIGAAFSADGITFTRVPAAESPHDQDGLVLTGKDAYPIATTLGAIVADPELTLVDGVYHLFFSSFACKGTDCATVDSSGIAHATSTDGIHWHVLEAPVRSLLRASADPRTGGAQPSVVYDAAHCRWEMWLTSDLAAEHDDQPVDFNNMAGVWHADSTDGTSWHINYVFARELRWGATDAGEHLGLLAGADVGASSNGRLMLYVGFDDQNVPSGFSLPDRTGSPASRAGVMTLNVATRDLP